MANFKESLIETISKNDVLVNLICDKYANYGIYIDDICIYMIIIIVIQRCILGANQEQMKKILEVNFIKKFNVSMVLL